MMAVADPADRERRLAARGRLLRDIRTLLGEHRWLACVQVDVSEPAASTGWPQEYLPCQLHRAQLQAQTLKLQARPGQAGLPAQRRAAWAQALRIVCEHRDEVWVRRLPGRTIIVSDDGVRLR